MRDNDDEHFSKKSKQTLKQNMWLINFLVVLVVLGSVMIRVPVSLMQNIEDRALAEVESTMKMQTTAYKNQLDEQFQALRLVADMLENGSCFYSEEIQPTLCSIVNTFRLCTFCMADMDGNTIDYQGNAIGSCSDREYFQEIIDGSHTQICEYLAETKQTSEPRIILSVPFYDKNNEIQGVLFCSKEIDILENSLFSNKELNDNAFSIFICDESGQVIASNENGYNFFAKYDNDGDDVRNVNDLSDSMQKVKKEGVAQRVEINGESCFAEYTAVDECGWGMYCLVKESEVSKTYEGNVKRIKNIILAIVFVFIGCLTYIYVLEQLYRRRGKREIKIIRQYNENYQYILSGIKCAVLEFDPDIKSVSTIQGNFGDAKIESLYGMGDEYIEFKKKHPEFDFSELETGLEIVKRQHKTCALETMLALNGDTFYWVNVKLLPILDENGEVDRVYCVMFDISDLHASHENILDTYAEIPGAVSRHSLSDPIHLDYYSEGFCKMLGYTHAEINEIIGTDSQYNNLILMEDRKIFIDFIENLTKKGGKQTCEYRMLCKDGSTIEVSETMEVKTGASGKVYGYAVVTDLYKYREEQKKLEQELEATQKKLIQSRMQNAGSQMQPHFLYNALASIREIILDDPEYASDLVYDFTTHLRACIRAMSNGALVPFKQEIDNINAYVNIEKMRFGDLLQLEYDCQITDFNIIQLSIQPLVENAIRHGIFQRGMSGGKVVIRTFRDGENIIISVEDDGVGFDYDVVQQEIQNGTRDSSGLANLTYRFKTMMNAEVTVESEIGTGTKIIVTIPNIRGGEET